MRKKHLILSVSIVTLLLVSPIAFAVEFGPSSAKITNRYYPAMVGSWSYMFGSGGSLGSANYTNVVGVEEVSGAQIGSQTFNNVKCLKVNMIQTSLNDDDDFISIWVAQDTDGNLWILKGYSHFEYTAFMLGTAYTSMFLPAAPQVNDPAGIIAPEIAEKNYCQIAEADMSIVTAYGSYASCIKINCYWDSSIDSVEYYCPDVGQVKYTESNALEIMELKEYGTAAVPRVVVIPLLN